ncbi:hypothetical protein KFE98_18510 [bacterium SCSIO 12741]|nr:hypothetical protein KFE98_18510 [bacterium SCSIO 12741]
MAPGNYTLTVTDVNNNSTITQAQVTTIQNIRFQSTAQNPNCSSINGGSINLSASGGNAPTLLAGARVSHHLRLTIFPVDLTPLP